jgi:hypothetical protein
MACNRKRKGKQYNREGEKSQESFKTRAPLDLYSSMRMENGLIFSKRIISSQISGILESRDFKPCNYKSKYGKTIKT